MAGSHELVTGGTTFGLRALRGQQVTKTGRAADQLTRTGYLEALGNGLFCLLHEWSGGKQSTAGRLARILSDKLTELAPGPIRRLNRRQTASYKLAGAPAEGFTSIPNRR